MRTPARVGEALFVRVGWMTWYSKRRERDGPVGGGSYNEDGTGPEVNNFQPRGGRFGVVDEAVRPRDDDLVATAHVCRPPRMTVVDHRA